MDNYTIFTKTAKGLGEALGKTKNLSREQRKILKEIDGKASFEDLVEQIGMDEVKLGVVINKLLADDYIREFGSSAPPGASPSGETVFDLTSPGVIEVANSQLTIGDFFRAMEPPPTQSGGAGMDFRNLGQPEAEIARKTLEQTAAQVDEIRRAIEEEAQRITARTQQQAAEAARHEAEEKARQDAEFARQQAIAQEQARAKQEAEEQARRAVEEKARQEAERKAELAAEEKARKAAEEAERQAARIKAEQEARRLAEETSRREAEERARRQAEEQARRQAEDAARKLAQEQAQEQARIKAEQEAKAAAEARAREQAAEQERARLQAMEEAHRVAEARAREEAEARARREAEEQARRQQEEEARRVADEEARKQAQEQARIKAREAARRAAEDMAEREAQAKARAEAERLAQIRAEEEARLAAEAEARRQAEEATRRAAEEQARREAGEQARLRAEEEARRAAEEKARREAEELAKKEAQERARQEAEEAARLKAEEKARQKAEAKARKEAEAQAKREAREQARRESEEKARQEAERKAQLAAEEKARKEAEAQARHEAKEKARQAAEEAARQKAEAAALLKAEKDAEKAARAAAREAENAAKEAGKAESAATAAASADIPAPQHAEETADAPAETASPLRGMRITLPFSLGKLVRVSVLALAALSVAGLGLIHIVPFNGRLAQLEQEAGAHFGKPVKIGSLNLSLLPQPHWRLQQVSIGADKQIVIPQVNATAAIGSLFTGAMQFHSVELVSPVIDEEGLGWILFGQTAGASWQVISVNASQVRLRMQQVHVPLFNASAEFDNAGVWRKIGLNAAQEKLHVDLARAEGVPRFEFTANDLVLPFGGTLAFDTLNASGTIERGGLDIGKFSAIIYDGTVSGSAALRWQDGWSLKGTAQARHIAPARLASGVFQGGTLEGNFSYAMQSADSARLLASPQARGSFSVNGGALTGVDMASYVMGQAGSGKTSFNELNGDFTFDGGKAKLSRMRLAAGLLSAGGEAAVDTDGRLSGHVTVDLRTASRQAHSAFNIGGTPAEPKFSR